LPLPWPLGFSLKSLDPKAVLEELLEGGAKLAGSQIIKDWVYCARKESSVPSDECKPRVGLAFFSCLTSF